MPRRPKFDTIYHGEWPYRCYEGVGLQFNVTELGSQFHLTEVMRIFGRYGCPAHISGPLLVKLQIDREVKTTVAHHLDFDELWNELQFWNIYISIIPPRPGYTPPRMQVGTGSP